jgi:hypothetical protein
MCKLNGVWTLIERVWDIFGNGDQTLISNEYGIFLVMEIKLWYLMSMGYFGNGDQTLISNEYEICLVMEIKNINILWVWDIFGNGDQTLISNEYGIFWQLWRSNFDI